jgi:hypothetical protein
MNGTYSLRAGARAIGAATKNATYPASAATTRPLSSSSTFHYLYKLDTYPGSNSTPWSRPKGNLVLHAGWPSARGATAVRAPTALNPDLRSEDGLHA